MNLWKHLGAILILPVMVTIVVPAVICILTGKIAVGWGFPFPYASIPPLFGCFVLGLGLWIVVTTIIQFARIGEGTLAPWAPTQKLVVQGIYRYMRNPMISGVVAILLGESVLLGSMPLCGWCLLFFALNAIYIPLSEERGLSQRFGEEYLVYKRNVPRWIPRLTPWTPPSDK